MEKLAACICNVKLFSPEMVRAGGSETACAVGRSNIGLRDYKTVIILVCTCCPAGTDTVQCATNLFEVSDEPATISSASTSVHFYQIARRQTPRRQR